MRDLKIKPGMDTPKAKQKNPAPKDAESILKKHMDERQTEKEPENRDPVHYAKLDIIQLRIQLLDLTTIWNAIRLFTKPLDFSFDFPRLRLSIGDTVQFVQPAEYLTVGEGDYLVILSCLCNGERKLPLRLSQAAAMKLENVFLTY